jgi:Chaperone of endosialidase/Secretion system C-terminal sorting domain
MRKTTICLTAIALLALAMPAAAQLLTQNPTNIGGIAAGQPDRIRAENGIIAHRVAGVVGGLGAADQWLGLGPARIGGVFNNSIYGLRIQRLGQGMLFNLVNNDAGLFWGPVNATNMNVGFIQNNVNQTTRNTFRFTKVNDSTGNSFALNGLLGHFVAGNFGQFTNTDQWIGIGQPFNGTAPISTIYGNRIQWAGQAFIQALRTRSATDLTKDAIIEWGNLGGDLRFRYITNPADPVNGFRNLLTIDTAGNALFGAARFSITPPKARVEVNATLQRGIVVNANSDAAAAFTATGVPGSSSTTGILVRASGSSFVNTGVDINTTGGIVSYGAIARGNGSSVGVGVFGQGATALTNYGVQGSTFSSQGNDSYGLYGEAFGIGSSVSSNYGVYGIASDASFNAAGYFEGDVYGFTFSTISDRKLKREVNTETGVMDKIRQLRPVTYYFDKEKNKALLRGASGNTLQHGFIAQELEEVFPEMVSLAKQPIRDEERKTKETVEIKTINYTMLIPVLTRAMQEQETVITKQETVISKQGAVIAKLEERIQQLEQKIGITAPKPGAAGNADGYTLSQNIPNPFSATTTIRYTMPNTVKEAMLGVFDLNGRMQLQLRLQPGGNQVQINGGALPAGIYIYSLIADGQEVMSKRMVLTK